MCGVAGDDDDVPFGDSTRNTPLDTTAWRIGVGVGQSAARDQRRHPFHHVVDLGGVHLVEVGAARKLLRTEHAPDPDLIVAGNLDDTNGPVADAVARQLVDELLDGCRRHVGRHRGFLSRDRRGHVDYEHGEHRENGSEEDNSEHGGSSVGRFALRTPVSYRDNLRGENRTANVSRVGLCSAVLGSKLFGGGEERPPVA